MQEQVKRVLWVCREILVANDEGSKTLWLFPLQFWRQGTREGPLSRVDLACGQSLAIMSRHVMELHTGDQVRRAANCWLCAGEQGDGPPNLKTGVRSSISFKVQRTAHRYPNLLRIPKILRPSECCMTKTSATVFKSIGHLSILSRYRRRLPTARAPSTPVIGKLALYAKFRNT